VSIERQIGAEGATWLDRKLAREVNHELAGHGFGHDVYQALVRRQQWLIEQGLMQGFRRPIGRRAASYGSKRPRQSASLPTRITTLTYILKTGRVL